MGGLVSADSQDNSISNYLNTISHAMLLCDDEPSPVSSDEVFFICEKQMNVDDRDESSKDENDCQDNDNESDAARSDCEDSKQRKTTTNRLNRTRGNKKSLENLNIHEETNRNTDKSVKEAESQTSHTILVKIQVENCSQCPDNKSKSLFSHEPQGSNKDNPCKKKKTVAVQVNFNSIESVVESHCVKISKVRCCNKASLLQSVAKVNKKSNNPESVERSDSKKSSADSTKIYLWSGKSAKKKSSLKSSSAASVEKPKLPPTIQEPSAKSNNCSEKGSIKSKKSPVGCSPLKKLNRSSLTIEPDKITINLSKYSPCASRLAASSKILSSNSPLSPESPLRAVSARSPRRIEHVRSVDGAPSSKQSEKMPLQASLSLNIHQFQKTHPTPRSRSVGDSCVTSPTSEATTLSYSPTGTEILSLEEVGPQSSLNEAAAIFVLPPPEIKDKMDDDYAACLRKANLETKC